MKIDFTALKKIHFTGIKGVAMAALATVAKEAGKKITGSDIEEEFPTAGVLQKIQITPERGFSKENIIKAKPDLVVYTGAHGGRDNPEVASAREAGIPVLPHGQALGLAMAGRKQITVAGSHGKTTASAMLATMLSAGGFDPSYAIGCGEIFGLGLPGHWGKGEYFVAEGDEYLTDPGHDLTPRFLWQKPEVLVVTNIDYDHPDAYRSLSEVQKTFLALQGQQSGKRITVINLDDPASAPLRSSAANTIITYGFSVRADLQITHLAFGVGRTFVHLSENGMPVTELSLKVPGRHNALNAAAVAAAGRVLGLAWPQIREGLLAFAGTKRRFEKLGETGGMIFYDDYAHHPAEIAATIAAVRAWYPKRRIVTLFQPHTYSRTKVFLTDFAQSLSQSDLVLLTEIYASARETDNLGVSGTSLAEKVLPLNRQTFFAPGREEAVKLLARNCRIGDIVIFMGAGDIYNWEKEIVEKFRMMNDE